jgi:hypothetical protein
VHERLYIPDDSESQLILKGTRLSHKRLYYILIYAYGLSYPDIYAAVLPILENIQAHIHLYIVFRFQNCRSGIEDFC